MIRKKRRLRQKLIYDIIIIESNLIFDFFMNSLLMGKSIIRYFPLLFQLFKLSQITIFLSLFSGQRVLTSLFLKLNMAQGQVKSGSESK